MSVVKETRLKKKKNFYGSANTHNVPCMYVRLTAARMTMRILRHTRVLRHVEHELSPIQSFRPSIRTDRTECCYLSLLLESIISHESRASKSEIL